MLTEKPLAVRASDADRVIAMAAARGLVVAVALQHRLRREVSEARRLLQGGALGTLHRAAVVAGYPKRSGYYRLGRWRGTWQGEGGGVLINQGQHDLDTLCYLMGRPAWVSARCSTRVQPIEAEDTAEAIVEWPSGATGSVHVTSAAVTGPASLEVTGSRGRLRILPRALELSENGTDFLSFAAAAGDPFDVPPAGPARVLHGGGGTHAELYRDLTGALAAGRPPVAPALGARDGLELANAITMSARSGRPVTLPLDRAGYDQFLDRLQSAPVAPAASR